MFVIGLTGGIGTGKTQVAKILEDLGAGLVNADLLGHEVYKPHTEGWQEVISAFGEQVLTSERKIDRRKLGEIVFSDEKSLAKLNAITHPRIYKLAEERIQTYALEGNNVAVLEAALLIEAEWASLSSEVWVVTSSREKVICRLKGRNNMDEDSIQARIDSQMPQAERVKHADVVISNDGTLEELREKIKNMWNTRVLAH